MTMTPVGMSLQSPQSPTIPSILTLTLGQTRAHYAEKVTICLKEF